jgi:Beta-ketoacyl synthase, N-terminal domain
MIYIHDSVCISPQHTFGEPDPDRLVLSSDGKLNAIEPSYTGVPPNIMRRMGKAVRIGVGAAMPLLADKTFIPAGIVIGTAMGGMEDCIRFLNQIIEYEEGQLTPTNFVQSTANAIASQIGLLTRNKAYNITHVHRGHAFENALIDVMMLLKENPAAEYLLGGIDEISTYNYNIDFLAGGYKKDIVSNADLYTYATDGTIAGEGAVMFRANNKNEGAKAGIKDVLIFQADDKNIVRRQINRFLDKHGLAGNAPDLLVTGENGDIRVKHHYDFVESYFGSGPTVARFKHMTGEYPTAVSALLWIAMECLRRNSVPAHALKTGDPQKTFDQVLIYNTFRGLQHSLILMSR